MVGWLDSAWKDFYAKDGTARVKKAFQRCGMLNALDGSETTSSQSKAARITRSTDPL